MRKRSFFIEIILYWNYTKDRNEITKEQEEHFIAFPRVQLIPKVYSNSNIGLIFR